MPTYEYKCPAGHVFEKFYPTMNDQRRIKCPTCGKLAVRQISGGAGLVFKGSGFYITDYKRAGEKQEEAKKDEAKPATEGKPATETKPPLESKGAKKKTDSGDK
jgi:putative FmdB family regulatory protein